MQGHGVVVAARQAGIGVVTALVIVVLHVETRQLREVDPQRAAAIVDVLTIQRLRHTKHGITICITTRLVWELF